MQVRHRYVFGLVCVALFLSVSLQNCLCSQSLVIPGGEFGLSDGGGQAQVEGNVPESVVDSVSPEKSVVDQAPTPDSTRPPEQSTGACPNGVDVVCFPCKFTLEEKEQIFLVHMGHALVGEGKTYRLISLETCQSQPFVWPYGEGFDVAKKDPMSSKVLLSTTVQADGKERLVFAYVDLSNPNKFVSTLEISVKDRVGAVSLGTPFEVRGLIIATLRNNQSQETGRIYVHYQNKGALLTQVTFPLEYSLEQTGQIHFFEEYEVFVLRNRVSDKVVRFPLAVWSVKDQKVVRIVDRGERPYPQNYQVFATLNNVYVLERQKDNRSKFDLVQYPIQKGDPLTVPISGCNRLWGDNVLGVMACSTGTVIHRFLLPGIQASDSVTLPEEAQPFTYYKGSWYFWKGGKIYRVPLKGDAKVQTISVPEPSSSLAFVGPFSTSRSSMNEVPQYSYRIFRHIVGDGQQIGVLDLDSGTFSWLKHKFPVPAIMGRMTEFHNWYAKMVSYYVEPMNGPQKPSLYLIKMGSNPEVIYEKTPAPFQFYGGELTLRDGRPLRAAMFNESTLKAEGSSEWNYALLFVHLQSLAKQRMTLDQPYTVHNVTRFVVLEPKYTGKGQREVTVLRIPQP